MHVSFVTKNNTPLPLLKQYSRHRPNIFFLNVSKVAFTIAAVVNVNDWRGTDTGAMHIIRAHSAPHVTRASIIGQIDVMIGCHSILARKQWRRRVIKRTWATLTRERIMSQFHLLTTTGVLSSLVHSLWCP